MTAIRMPRLLASTIVAAELLLAAGIALSVDTEARIRATVAAGETIVAAVEGYRRRHGVLPPTLEHLVPRHLASVPQPQYGTGTWQFEVVAGERSRGDAPVGIPLRSSSLEESQGTTPAVMLLSVRLDPTNPATRFRRTPGGCWQLPEFPKCW